MPRNTTRPEAILMLSPSATARAIGVHPRVVTEAILMGHLIVRMIGPKRRVAIFGEGGVQQWIEKFPIAKPRRVR